MAEQKRYYWLKFQNDFFTSKRIKKLRKLGADYVIIYLKMQLLSLKTDGRLEFTGLEKTFADELALDIDEDVDKVQLTLSYLQSCGLLDVDDNEFILPYVENNIGCETAVAQRVRDYRSRQKALHCNTSVTDVKQIGNGEKEIEIEIELDKEKSKPKEKAAEVTQPKVAARPRFQKPSIEELKDYIGQGKYNVDAEMFFDYYEANGWRAGKNPMKDWKATVRNWHRRENAKQTNKPTAKIEINAKQREGMTDVVDWGM